jgi:hypothetical protein
MNGKRILFTLVLAALICAPLLADEITDHQATRSDRTEADVQRTEAPTQAQPGLGEQMTPMLEPGLAAIEEDFGQQMKNLKAELDLAVTEEQREAIQQQMQSLKIEWALASANRQLELARQNQDAEAEAEILEDIARMTNPITHDRTPIARDPNAGIKIEGGAK